MMDGRRHSVDIPISKTLVALTRVRSLRDPSTNSLSKFSGLVENLRWDTYVSNGVALGFENASNECGTNKDISRSTNLSLCGQKEGRVGDHQRRHFLRKPRCENSYGFDNADADPPRARQIEISDLDKSNPEVVYGNQLLNERCFDDYRGKEWSLICVTPSSDCLEGVGSCNGPIEGLLKANNTDHDTMKRKSPYGKHTKSSRAAAAAVITCMGSPCLSTTDAAWERSSHGTPLHENEDVEVVDPNHHGCGISCCWSRTPRFRESNLSSDIEVQPLLAGVAADMRLHGKRKASKHLGNSYASYSRSIIEKFRPKSFRELVGQNVVARSLLSAISNGRIAPFYLFHGPRGTGKTSTARIFAAALNCVASEDDRPCGLCQDCVLSFSGRSMNIKEVDSIRVNRTEKVISLIKNALIHPASSRFRVFIVDDCHLVRGETWSTILNNLEELSQHVVFIMITPNLDKLPRSVVAHSQGFHFLKIKDVDITNRLGKICVEEGIEFDQVALDFIATKSNGSLREAEMMLEQLSLLGKAISLSLVYELTGTVSDDELLDLLDLALSSDNSNTVRRARELMRSRIDPMRLISQLANLIMDVLAGNCAEGSSEVRRKFLRRHSSEADMQQLSQALKILSETEKQLRASKNQKTWLTAALLQLSSINCSHLDAKDSRLGVETVCSRDGDFCSILSMGENLKHAITCTCENKEACKSDVAEKMETLESIWARTKERCKSSSLRSFLRKKGKLSSVSFNQGFVVVVLEFHHPNHVSRAEKSWKLIASAFQFTLGCNIEIRMDLVHLSCANKYAKIKKPSFNLFSCSRRMYQSPSTTKYLNDPSECSCHTSGWAIEGNKFVQTCSSESVSQSSNASCHIMEEARTIRNTDGNALSVQNTQSQRLLPDIVQKQHGWGVFFSKKSGSCGCRALSAQQLDKQLGSFSQSNSIDKNLHSQDIFPTICYGAEPSSNLVLSMPSKKSSGTRFCASNSYILSDSANFSQNCSRNKDGSMESSKKACWKTPSFPFKKAWQLRNQPLRAPLVGWVFPCAKAK